MIRLEFDCSLRYTLRLHAGRGLHRANLHHYPQRASGSGKTTILSILAGLVRPDRGRIRLDSTVLFDSEAKVNLSPESRRIGYLFQDYLLFPHLNVRRNLLYGWRRRPPDARPPSIESASSKYWSWEICLIVFRTLFRRSARRYQQALLSGPHCSYLMNRWPLLIRRCESVCWDTSSKYCTNGTYRRCT